MEYIYLNGKKSVAIQYKKDTSEVESVLINGSVHDFKEEKNPNKMDYAIGSKRSMYKQFLNNQFENLSVLTGAGSSVGIGETNKGRLLTQLWDDVENKITLEVLNRFCDLVDYNDKYEDGSRIKNLEKLLSIANVAKNYIFDKPENGTSLIKIDEIINKIEIVIKKKCTITLPKESPHKEFLEKITKRKVTAPRVKVFTLNYDTLFEQAGRNSNYTIIDGFSFSIPRKFSGRNFDYDIVSRNSSRVKEEDNFINKVFHLYKPHGSIDWERDNKGDIYQKDNVKNSLMIYPKDSKYESSYDQPFFEMMSRFQQSLRNDNVLLICIGFSFNDKHIVSAIIEALEQNPSFQLMVVNKGIDEKSESFKPFFEAAKKYNNIALVDEEFADFAKHYPDLKSYNHEDSKKIIINNNISTNV
ncbi:NAD-dependent SIR2 family protein deacetylase [Wenyingzhuangia heitensis]|uniref:NAD-dependent SIR2 family protein deacetylase n=1 Tax=Wenyingzhuangia heitensis TaxID=1487859 RepID=A0ABX0UCD9_9FLAO|nr:SIR2 family protein [Wenyingzhuangia heitensis]NIJ46403.1 NAD-dependent SIR2 family protein deacetylase [Wenyingzhuangia heitensis]